MMIASVSQTRGGSGITAAGQWTVNTAAQNARRVFRLVFYLRFAPQELADSVVIDQATTLAGSFQSYTYNALSEQTPAPAISQVDGALVVKLDGPQQVLAISVDSSAADDGDVLELYRLDGPNIASAASMSAQFQSAFFGDRTVVSGLKAFSLRQGIKLRDPRAELPPGFTDVQFAIRVRRSDGSHPTLSTSTLKEVSVESSPTGPRIGIASPDNLAGATPVWPQGPVNSNSFDVGGALAAALRTYLNTQASPLSAPVDVAILFQSDARCSLTINSLQVGYHYTTESLDVSAGGGDKKKTVLHFSGAELLRQSASIRLPLAATIVSSQFRVAENFHQERPGQDGTGALLWPAHGRQAVRLDADKTDHWAAQLFSISRMETVAGILVAVMPLAENSELLVQLHVDANGTPGKSLVEGKLPLVNAQPSWMVLRFQKPIDLSAAERFWVLLRATRGNALWLADASTGDAIHIFQQQSGTFDSLTVLDGLQAALKPVLRLETQSQAAETPAAILSIADAQVSPAVTNGSSTHRQYDLSNALNSRLNEVRKTGSPSSSVVIPLDFTSAIAGQLTVYAPNLVFDL